MFVAIKDLAFAKGRFILMGGVVALITLLVVLLSGLTAGLGRDSTSAITSLPADHLVFSAPANGQKVSFDDSQISPDTTRQWSQVPGVVRADPLAIAMTRASVDGRNVGIAAFSVAPGSPLAPQPVSAGKVVLSKPAAKALDAVVGDRIEVAGRSLAVSAVAGDASYSHAAVVWTTLADRPVTGAPSDAATVLALRTSSGADLAAADARLHTSTVRTDDSLSAIGSYTSENGSLQLMRVLLFAISALVVGAFFTVWTVQRGADIAVLKALGASTRYLLRDALGQALLLLGIGTAAGTAVAAGLGLLASNAVPFVVSAATTLVPAAIMIALGLLGAAAALRRITSVDPLTALGSAR